jgi:uncharacterized protein YndB with AHSA1/START domain
MASRERERPESFKVQRMPTPQPAYARVTQRFDASPERVFDAWLDPGILGTWMFGPNVREEEIVRLTVDPRVGGAFSFLVRRQGIEIDHVGEYLELVRPHRLAFTWGIRENLPETSHIRIDIRPLDIGCELILVHELHPKWADYADRTQAGWTKMLVALAAVL